MFSLITEMTHLYCNCRGAVLNLALIKYTTNTHPNLSTTPPPQSATAATLSYLEGGGGREREREREVKRELSCISSENGSEGLNQQQKSFTFWKNLVLTLQTLTVEATDIFRQHH